METTLEQTIAALVNEHGQEAVQEALNKHVSAADTTTDPPGSTNPPPPKP